MKDTLLQLLRDKDTFAIVDYVQQQTDPLATINTLDELMRDLYWKQKNLAPCIALGRLAVQYGLEMSGRLETENAAIGVELRGKAKAICYNIASFTWSGWGEAGIRITPSDEAIGLDAARANLRLGRELKRGDLAMSRAHWMLGAQQISAGDYSGAIESFAGAERLAVAAKELGDQLLAAAFARLAEFLENRTDEARFQRVVEAVGELCKITDGAAFAEQVTMALRIFRPDSRRILLPSEAEAQPT